MKNECEYIVAILRKLHIGLFVAMLSCGVAYAQSVGDSIGIADTVGGRQKSGVSGDAFGLRLGAGPDRSGEVALSWHKGIGKYRIETDLGWATCDQWSYLSVSAVFHFKWHITKGLNWYVGPGINIGWYFGDNHFGAGAGAQIGIEYNFPFPLQLSLDIYPRYNIIGPSDAVGLGGSGGLSVRYRF